MTSALLALTLAMPAQAAPASIKLDLRKRGVEVSKDLYGIFFEEINHAGDGGVYAEQLQNGGMILGESGKEAPHWRTVSGASRIDGGAALNDARKRSLWFDGKISNLGYWGIAHKASQRFEIDVWAKGSGELHAELGGRKVRLGTLGPDWKRFQTQVSARKADTKGELALEVAGGEAWLGFASLKPANTWKDQPIRSDLGGLIDAMRPAFVRFPGGCFVEGQDFDRMWDWKASLGPIETRPGKDWRFWGYPSTDGLGYHEYLAWTEKMGSEALFVANCGMTHGPVAPMSEMGRFVQDALDAIEYAIGPVDSKWGALRAKNGHPKPFPLKYVQIGNENGGPAYNERYALMAKAISEKYPQIQLIACVWGGVPTSWPLQIIDEHYYSNPSFFWQNVHKYDSYDRRGPKVYVGEFAVTQGSGQGNLEAGLSEAAFMTGMERNADIVTMSSYAPLLANSNRKQWNPNAIVFDNHRSYGTPSYWVQRLFAQNRPDFVVPATVEAEVSAYRVSGEIGLQTWKTRAEFKDLEVEADGRKLAFTSWQGGPGSWRFEGGTAVQSDLEENRRATAQGIRLERAERFTIRLKARKLAGDEGFILMFGLGGGVPMQWNLGGWGNKTHAFQMGGGGPLPGSVPGGIETGRWYDLRLEGRGDLVEGYLDGKLVQQTKVQPVPNFASVAGIDRKKGELVLKIVNGAEQARTVSLNMKGAELAPMGTAIVLTGPSMDAENSLQSPNRISPKTKKIGFSDAFRYTAPARSLSILRVKIR